MDATAARPGLPIGRLKAIYARLARRYDWQHRLLTLGADERGRRLLVHHAVRPGDRVLDCGAGTGSTGLHAARRVGPRGTVTFFDLSEEMLAVAKAKTTAAGLEPPLRFESGDLTHLPYADGAFDAVLSTYSLCPVYDPADGARELYRVTRPGGRLGIAHSTEPGGTLVRRLAHIVEALAWQWPALSMGCRAVEVLPALEAAGARLVLDRTIGVPLWPFRILVLEKPADGT